MAEHESTTLGYLMDYLRISTVSMAHKLHVDPSLVSKWRSGSRRLGVQSIYFEEVCSILLEENQEDLTAALRTLDPLAEYAGAKGLAPILHNVLTERHFTVPKAFSRKVKALCTAEIALYVKGEGRRQAVFDLLDIAENMETPSEMLYIDSEQSGWLLENAEYGRVWVARMLRLLNRGFHIRIALHFSMTVEKFVAFFQLCNPLIFHRNAQWFHHQYYDDNTYWFSFFILEHAMSIMGVPLEGGQGTTTVFTDTYSIIQHKNFAERVLADCRPMFSSFAPGRAVEMIQRIYGKGNTYDNLFSFLPAPAFITVKDDLFNDIIKSNGITGEAAALCREANMLVRNMAEQQLMENTGELIQILQLDEMEERISSGFYSTSLSLLSGHQVMISRDQYARGLLELLERIEQYGSYKLLLASPADDIRLPAMNCWCYGSAWMIQMDSDGFRLCQEQTLSGAAYITLEQGWRRVPPARKDKAAVAAVLRRLIDELNE